MVPVPHFYFIFMLIYTTRTGGFPAGTLLRFTGFEGR